MAKVLFEVSVKVPQLVTLCSAPSPHSALLHLLTPANRQKRMGFIETVWTTGCRDQIEVLMGTCADFLFVPSLGVVSVNHC